jgi:ubiquinone/menaquinone biosynthesis C-methylase UbiE
MTIQNNASETERFNHWSQTYEQHLGQFFLFDPVQRKVLQQVAAIIGNAEPLCILDVGCGTGRLLRKAATRWPKARLVGVDLAEGMIEIARCMTPGAEFVVSGAETLPLPDESVDAAISTISFHHWQDQTAGLRNVVRVLRPGGVFCLADIVLPVWFTRFYRVVNPIALAHTYQHFRETTSATMAGLFTNAGLRVVSQHRIRAGFVLVTTGVK